MRLLELQIDWSKQLDIRVFAIVEGADADQPCGDGVTDCWREVASWTARELDRAFYDAARVQYYDLFDAECPRLPEGAVLPVVLVGGDPITVGKKIAVPAIWKALAARGVAAGGDRMSR